MKLLTMIKSGEVRIAAWENKNPHSERAVGRKTGEPRPQAETTDRKTRQAPVLVRGAWTDQLLPAMTTLQRNSRELRSWAGSEVWKR